ncbi:D-alanyl-D-alanine carboxypeptidase/D-alanyl-D-alanine-endopeptidase [Marinobacter sp. M1N3S26]|uniref:D-alanyl-D-alanine carboxypeptidase/D-alanyl-D-alanine endopeptidase n=1 Tax=Marinobacter sp. M1N3S26 TaxID=3382299 RepID=UPI00387AE20F
MWQLRSIAVDLTGLYRSLGAGLTAAALLSLPVTAAAEGTTTEPRLWSNEVQGLAQESLDDVNGLSVAAVPLDGPGIEQFINADTVMSPGSIMKLLTTYAALEILGPNYRWTTRFYTDGDFEGDTLKGDLYVYFDGDPKLTIERLWVVLREIRAMGVRNIEGDVVLDGRVFALPDGLPKFHDNGNNPHRPFLVEPSPVLLNMNLVHFQVRADERGTQAWATPALPAITIDNRITAIEEGPCPSRRRFTWEPVFDNRGNVTVTVEGELPEGCRTTSYLSLLPQDQYSGELIIAMWQELGGTISGGWRQGVTPSGSRLVSSTTSPDLVTMVRDINKWSSNVMARQLLITIGAENRHPADNDDRVSGIRAIYDWLEGKGIDTQGMVIDNGSGLSRHARMTARQLSAILTNAWSSPYSADLMTSMPLTAMDGTMARRLRDLDMEGMGRIKTGSLQDVRSVAGFTRDDNNTTWAVVGIINHSPAWKGQSILDKVLYTLHTNPPTGTALSQAGTQ